MYDNGTLYDLPDLLAKNSYPGRGIVLGKTPDGHALAMYFIMGRSENSRNRVFELDGDALRIGIHDQAKLGDASLILYQPVRVWDGHMIVTNGDQTDTIYEALASGGTFVGALNQRRHEPDAPHFTPRISGLLPLDGQNVTLSVLRAGDAAGTRCDRLFFQYDLAPGEGRFVHTYLGDGSPLPAFEGEPARVNIPHDIPAFADAVWHHLNENNRVALYVYKNGQPARIYNRHATGGNA